MWLLGMKVESPRLQDRPFAKGDVAPSSSFVALINIKSHIFIENFMKKKKKTFKPLFMVQKEEWSPNSLWCFVSYKVWEYYSKPEINKTPKCHCPAVTVHLQCTIGWADIRWPFQLAIYNPQAFLKSVKNRLIRSTKKIREKTCCKFSVLANLNKTITHWATLAVPPQGQCEQRTWRSHKSTGQTEKQGTNHHLCASKTYVP